MGSNAEMEKKGSSRMSKYNNNNNNNNNNNFYLCTYLSVHKV